MTHLKGDLCSKNELVSFKQSSASVLVDHVCDAIDKVNHSLLDVISRFCPLNSILKHHTERLYV